MQHAAVIERLQQIRGELPEPGIGLKQRAESLRRVAAISRQGQVRIEMRDCDAKCRVLRGHIGPRGAQILRRRKWRPSDN